MCYKSNSKKSASACLERSHLPNHLVFFLSTGSRMFPPSSGLTLSCWFLVSKFGVVHNSHPLRFLTIVRHMSRTEQEFVCFSVSFSPQDGSLVISTEEVEFQPLGEAFLRQAAVLFCGVNDTLHLCFSSCSMLFLIIFKFALNTENYLVACSK